MRTQWVTVGTIGLMVLANIGAVFSASPDIDQELKSQLASAGFQGKTQESLEKRLGRSLDPKLVEVGRLMFFDKMQGLHRDNSCAGCHAPAAGFGDFKSIAIGVDSNDIVGASRKGPRNQRRTPSVINNAFYPALMWNGRFLAPSGDPFDNSLGFAFPDPEGNQKFPANNPNVKILLAAQGHIPGTELPEMAGFTGISGVFAMQRFKARADNKKLFKSLERTSSNESSFQLFSADNSKLKLFGVSEAPDFAQFDDGHGDPLPPARPDGTRNEPIRDLILSKFNGSAEYRRLFGEAFPGVKKGEALTFAMLAQALSEFQVSLTFADAPIDRYARGDMKALTVAQKHGAVLFFGKANCISCHQVKGTSNEMFSDFKMYNSGIPQIYPRFGKGTGNVPFRNASGEFVVDGQYDFGLEDITGNAGDRFKFRTSPLRNLHLQKSFFHNGSFTSLEDAVRYHLDPVAMSKKYSIAAAKVEPDLYLADFTPVLASLDLAFSRPVKLTDQEVRDLVDFLRNGLADPDATPENLSKLIPAKVPSGLPLQKFQ